MKEKDKGNAEHPVWFGASESLGLVTSTSKLKAVFQVSQAFVIVE